MYRRVFPALGASVDVLVFFEVMLAMFLNLTTIAGLFFSSKTFCSQQLKKLTNAYSFAFKQ